MDGTKKSDEVTKNDIVNTEDAKNRGGVDSVKVSADINYISIHGTVPDSVVAAKSHLCEDMHQHLITMA